MFGVPVDFEGYKAWRLRRREDLSTLSADEAADGLREEGDGEINGNADPERQPTMPPVSAVPKLTASGANGAAAAPYPSSFARIVELIASGQPIPGVREIPDTVLHGQASESTAPRRRKPWEGEVGGGGRGESEREEVRVEQADLAGEGK